MGEELNQERPGGDPVIELVVRFNQALNCQDVGTMMGLMTEDCVFENTDLPPEGTRYESQKAVRAFWEEFFRSSREPGIESEEIFAAGERCAMRWVYRWVGLQGEPGHIRGVDIYKIRDGKIAEKLSYVKG
jgi:ketosteroid isomerase-like protein